MPEAPPPPEKGVILLDPNSILTEKLIWLATAYPDENIWLHCLVQSGQEQDRAEFVACASGPPKLRTALAPL